MWFLLVLVGGFALEYVQTWLMNMIGQRIMFDMRMQIYGHLQRLDLRDYDRNPVGRLMTRVTSDIDVLNDLFSSGIVAAFGDVFMLTGIMIVLLTMDWRLSLIAFSVLPLILLVTQWFRVHVRESYRDGAHADRADQRVPAGEHHRHGDGAVVPAGSGQPGAVRRHQPPAPRREHPVDLLLRGVLSGDRVDQRAGGSADHLVRRRLGDDRHADARLARRVPAVFAALLPADQRYVGKVQPAAGGDGVIGAHLRAARHAGHGRIAGGAEAAERRAARAAWPGPGHIKFENVWFAYKDDTFVLRDVSFDVHPGERIGIVGATGAGKSTVINLLLRFYDVTRGRITIDGVDLREMSLADVRGLFGLVLQDVYLFTGTIASNVRLGNERITDEDVRRAVKAVHADRFIDRLPKASTRRSPSAAPRCRSVRSSCCRSRARWPSTRACWCSTKRRRASTPKPNS